MPVTALALATGNCFDALNPIVIENDAITLKRIPAARGVANDYVHVVHTVASYQPDFIIDNRMNRYVNRPQALNKLLDVETHDVVDGVNILAAINVSNTYREQLHQFAITNGTLADPTTFDLGYVGSITHCSNRRRHFVGIEKIDTFTANADAIFSAGIERCFMIKQPTGRLS